MRYQKKYLDYGKNEARDRFNVEFSNKENLNREMFDQMKLAVNEHMDASTIKFWAEYGWLAFTHHDQANKRFLEQLTKNINNKRDKGINVEMEIDFQFRQRKDKLGGNSFE